MSAVACGDDVLAQALEQVGRRGVLGRRGRDGEDRRHLAVLARRRRRHGGDAGRVGDRLLQRAQLLLGLRRTLGCVDGEQEGTVGSGAERRGQLVVGDALRARLGLVAVVGLADPHLDDREGEDQQQRDAGGDRHPGPTGDDLAPAREGRRGLHVLRLLRHQPAPEGAHHDRKNRQRRDDHRGDRDRRAKAHLADVRDADHQQPGDRHHHDQARGHHSRAGGRRRAPGRDLQAVARRPLLAVAPDDQQRVVDPGSEAEHRRDHRRKRGQAERIGKHGQQDLARRDADERTDEGRGHRPPGAKQHGQQDDRNEHADELADRGLLLYREIDQDAARLDLNLRLGGLAGCDQRLAVLLLDFPGLGGVAHVNRRQALVLGHLPAGLERTRDQLDALELAHLRQRALDRLPRLRIGDLALVDREDQGRIRPAERRRVRLEEINRLLRLGPRKREVVAGRLRGAGRKGQQHQDADRRREAALPVRGQRARDARQKPGRRSGAAARGEVALRHEVGTADSGR